MCGCTSGINGPVNSTSCYGRSADLHKIRNNLITLERLVGDQEQIDEYQGVRRDVEQLLKDAVEACPDLQTITNLRQYIENEFSKYNN